MRSVLKEFDQYRTNLAVAQLGQMARRTERRAVQMPTREIIEVRTLGGNKACVFVEKICGIMESTPSSSTLLLDGLIRLDVHGSGPNILAKIQNPINLLSEETAIKDTPPEKAVG